MESLNIVGENDIVVVENSMAILKKLNTELPSDPTIPLETLCHLIYMHNGIPPIYTCRGLPCLLKGKKRTLTCHFPLLLKIIISFHLQVSSSYRFKFRLQSCEMEHTVPLPFLLAVYPSNSSE